MTKNWKFLTKSEVNGVIGNNVVVYDGHFDNTFEYEAVVCEVKGQYYLGAYDFHSKKIFPLVEKNGRLEVVNTLTIGYVDGTTLNICNVFSKEDKAKLYWRNQSTLNGEELDGIEDHISTALESGDYNTVKCFSF